MDNLLGEEDEAYLVNQVGRLWSLAGWAAGLGDALLGMAGETTRWCLHTYVDLVEEEALVLLVRANLGGQAWDI